MSEEQDNRFGDSYQAEILKSIPGTILVYSIEDGDMQREYFQNNLDIELPEFGSLLGVGKYIHSKSLREFAVFLNEFLEGKTEPKNAKIQLEIPNEKGQRRVYDMYMVNEVEKQRLVLFIIKPESKPVRQLIEDKNTKRVIIGKAKLTQRELLVLRHIANGLKTSEIAKETDRSVYTIENTKRRLFRKLSLKNVNELVRFAAEYDIV